MLRNNSVHDDVFKHVRCKKVEEKFTVKCLYNTRLKRVRAFVIKGSQKARLAVFVKIGLYNEDRVMQREVKFFFLFSVPG